MGGTEKTEDRYEIGNKEVLRENRMRHSKHRHSKQRRSSAYDKYGNKKRKPSLAMMEKRIVDRESLGVMGYDEKPPSNEGIDASKDRRRRALEIMRRGSSYTSNLKRHDQKRHKEDNEKEERDPFARRIQSNERREKIKERERKLLNRLKNRKHLDEDDLVETKRALRDVENHHYSKALELTRKGFSKDTYTYGQLKNMHYRKIRSVEHKLLPSRVRSAFLYRKRQDAKLPIEDYPPIVGTVYKPIGPKNGRGGKFAGIKQPRIPISEVEYAIELYKKNGFNY